MIEQGIERYKVGSKSQVCVVLDRGTDRYLFIGALIFWLVYFLIDWLINLFINLLINLLLINLFIYLFLYSFTYLFIDSFILSFPTSSSFLIWTCQLSTTHPTLTPAQASMLRKEWRRNIKQTWVWSPTLSNSSTTCTAHYRYVQTYFYLSNYH